MTKPATLPPAEAIDRHIGAQLRKLRQRQILTMAQLGELVGLTYQQIQKYELGTNRIACSTLYRLALALQTEPAAFFEGLPDTAVPKAPHCLQL